MVSVCGEVPCWAVPTPVLCVDTLCAGIFLKPQSCKVMTSQNPFPRVRIPLLWSYGGRQAAVYGSGLLEGGGFRRHAKLRGAWWGPTVSRGGLYQGSSR